LAETIENTLIRKICGSRNANSADLDPQNLRPIKTDINHTEQNQSQRQTENLPPYDSIFEKKRQDNGRGRS